MGKVDIKINNCLKDAKRYADCFNTAAGSVLISPEELVDMERISEGSICFPKTIVYYKKERDGIRGIRNKENVICAIVCLENQTDIYYAEAVKHLIYDAYSYNKQLTDIRNKHETQWSIEHIQKSTENQMTEAIDEVARTQEEEQIQEEIKDYITPPEPAQEPEYGQIQKPINELTTADKQIQATSQIRKDAYPYQGFSPEDRLLPVVTVCIYYGEEPWDAPTRITDLMDFSGFTKQKARLWKKYIQDYKIIVLDIRRMPDQQIEQMSSDLKLLFGMLKHSDDKDALLDFIKRHEEETNCIKKDLADAFTILSGTTGLKKYLNRNKIKGGDTVKMCKAINDLIKDGEERGKAQGEAIGEARGEARGETKGRYNTFIELLKDNLISLEEAAKRLNMSEDSLRKQL